MCEYQLPIYANSSRVYHNEMPTHNITYENIDLYVTFFQNDIMQNSL